MRGRAIVVAEGPVEARRAGRTVRALAAAGVDVAEGPPRGASLEGPIWFVRAGAWPVALASRFPPPSATGLPLCALGAVRPPDDAVAPCAAAWQAFLARSGGDFGALDAAELPPLASVYLEPPLAARLCEALAAGAGLRESVLASLGRVRARVVRFEPLDVHDDPRLRVAEVVTSLQQGGAERIALDLARSLAAFGVRARLFALGPPGRRAFPAPPGTVDFARARAADLEGALVRDGADVVHAHLLDGPSLARLSRAGFPVVATVHNALPGWPRGLARLGPGDAALLVACARAVEADLRAAEVAVPVRTVWNGIDFARFTDLARVAEAPTRRTEERARLGIGQADVVLLSLANPRPQKRLERLPAVLAAARAAAAPREVRLVLAGSTSSASREAGEAEAAFSSEVRRLGLEASVHALGAVADVAPLVAAADVLVSTSAFEGLSLAHLEALAGGLGLVATDAGGTREIAAGNPAVRLLPLDAPPEAFAGAALALARPETRAGGREAAALDFRLKCMAAGYARLLPRAIEAARGPRRREGVLLLTNNFSTGGAQSSARRLLSGLVAEGMRARAAVIEEDPAHPTPGRRALAARGIEVLVLPAAGAVDPADALLPLLDSIDADPPAAILLWNARPAYKVLLADLVLDVPLFDVSPGAMCFTSLEKYFARPRAGLPYRTAREYGARLAGVVVKYAAEAARARETLGAPVHVIPNGVALGDAARRAPAPGAPLAIGTLARLSPQKRVEDLLDALRRAAPRLPPHVLRIAGGPERGAEAYAAELRERARGLAVEWAGEVEDERPFLRGLDLFAMISDPPGCPNASLEAMAEGLAVVATAVGGAVEQVVDGASGRLVPSGDAAAFAEALVELARDPARRARFGAEGRARVAERFSLERMVGAYRELCLGARAAPVAEAARV